MCASLKISSKGVSFSARVRPSAIRDLFLDDPQKNLFTELTPELSQLPFKEAKDRMLDIFHRQYVEVLLQENNGNVSRAAEKSGIQRQYFHRLMKEAGIDADGFKPRME